MLSKTLALSGDEVLCEYTPVDEFKGFLQQRLGVAPDTLAILIRDGEVVYTAAGAHIAIGGVWQSIKESLGGSHSLQLLLADSKPFDATFAFESLSRDKVVVHGEITLQLQVDTEAGSNILGLASSTRPTRKAQVFERLIPHFGDRALQSVIGLLEAGEIRGAVDVQNKLQAEMLEVAEHVLGDCGIVVRASSINWAANEVEAADIASRAAIREQVLLDEKLENYGREIDRAERVTSMKIRSELATEKLKSMSENELRMLINTQELDFIDARESGARAARIKTIQGEIDELVLEQQGKSQLSLADAKTDVELRKINHDMRALELKTEDLERKQRSALYKLEELDKLEIAEAAQVLQEKRLRGLQGIDLDKARVQAELGDNSADRQTERELAKDRQADDTELARIRLQQSMSADQILAMQAGLSEAVAAVFVEKAKTDQASGVEKQQLMEKLIESGAKSGDDAKYFFEQFKQGVIGVAAGSSEANVSGNRTGEQVPVRASTSTSEGSLTCPRCKNVNSADRQFCINCSGPLRV